MDSNTFCNTEAFIARVNTEQLCGYSDWRLPTIFELTGLLNLDRWFPTIDTDYFPNTYDSRSVLKDSGQPYNFLYASSTPTKQSSDRFYAIEFGYGATKQGDKLGNSFVRLVRD